VCACGHLVSRHRAVKCIAGHIAAQYTVIPDDICRGIKLGGGLFDKIKNVVKNVAHVAEKGEQVVKKVANNAKKVGNNAKNVIKKAATKVENNAKNVVNTITDKGKTVAKNVGKDIDKHVTNILKAAGRDKYTSPHRDNIKKVLSNLQNNISNTKHTKKSKEAAIHSAANIIHTIVAPKNKILK
jgi:ElaB/YqjD/DUF883 family membrane-anchored ribosome-binding protein